MAKELKTSGVSMPDDSKIEQQFTDFYAYGTEQEKLDANVAVRNIPFRVYLGDTFRTSAGSQTITGIWFTPRMIKFTATDGNKGYSTGWWKSGYNNVVYIAPTASYQSTYNTLNCIWVDDNSGNKLSANVTSVWEGEFTLSWSLSWTKTCNFWYEVYG